ncbi:hypothetical protein TNIN_102421 [Trichonephila inaurata madagascariensis]|uniref:Uncharacterized protein n=1 Tax=Trichonephila inaurata madagascariensis TaxID=2747483 RepID=A0A8X6XEF1_9ARAC|nr:hypothetical protein TNIN_102421 [Trichonephila inaurata madagascariensis]
MRTANLYNILFVGFAKLMQSFLSVNSSFLHPAIPYSHYSSSETKQTILLFYKQNLRWLFSELLEKADVLPILKPKKDSMDAQSLRPIFLTCILSKLSERMVVD